MSAPIKIRRHLQASGKSALQTPHVFIAAAWPKVANGIRRCQRMIRLAAHLSSGLGVVSLLFPRYSERQRNQRINQWSYQLTRMLGLRIKICGIPPPSEQQTLILANHISWVDIFALNSVSTARFVAKAEVGRWPLIGQLCKGTGTLFIERGNKRSTVHINHEIIAGLEAGQRIAVFPEGTTSDGSSLKPFRSSLLQPAIECQTTIQPVYLRYVDATGNASSAAAYCDDISFGASMWKLLGSKDITVELHYLESMAVTHADDRRELSKRIESRLREKHAELSLVMIDNYKTPAPEISHHHPTAPR